MMKLSLDGYKIMILQHVAETVDKSVSPKTEDNSAVASEMNHETKASLDEVKNVVILSAVSSFFP